MVVIGGERRAKLAHHLDLFAQLGRRPGADRLIDLGVVQARHDPFGAPPLPGPVLEQHEVIADQVVAALEASPHADRPAHRRDLQLQRVGDLVKQIEWVAHVAIELVDEGRDRHVAQAADLEQLPGLRLDALCGVEHHDRRVHGGQGAVRVLAEILVTRGV